MAKPCVRVYNGDGAGSRSVLSTVEALHQVLKPDLEVGAASVSFLHVLPGLPLINAFESTMMPEERTSSGQTGTQQPRLLM